jgi:VanZ family protein
MKTFLSKQAVWLTLLPVLAIMIAIFCFSAQKGEASTQTSGHFVQWIVAHFYPDFDQMDAAEQQALGNSISHAVRKTAHFIEYGALGFALLLHLWTVKKRTGLRFPKLLSQLIGTAYAASDELHQKLVSGREAAVGDVLLDSAGVLFGILMMALLLYLCGKYAARRSGRGRSSDEE